MIRVVADTNVYVFAMVFGGTCQDILALARAQIIELHLSPPMREELRFVLRQTFGWPAPHVREALLEITGLATLVRPARRIAGVVAHDEDHRILECALAARAEFLVTGDKKHLLPLGTYEGVRIVSPRQFLEMLG